jgi:DnaJ homolog subfamily A member 2
MDFNKDYYSILGVSRIAEEKEIKKSYYKLSFINHPDRGGDPVIFGEMTEAYDVLTSEEREEYDRRSKWGNNYDETLEILNFEFSNSAKFYDEDKYDEWKEKNQLNVIIHIDDTFNGTIEYERWVICKECGGNGKDTSSKIAIKDKNGNILKMFEGSDGCDFCEGSGKDYKGDKCYFCNGEGKVGWTDCKFCHGERKILGKQKLTGIKFPEGEKAHKIDAMGNASTIEWGKVGCLWLIKK